MAAVLVCPLSLWSCSLTPPASIATAASAGGETVSIRFAGPAYRGGVVAVANPYGAEAGAEILRRGGNAVDAAVAIAYALNVVEPQSAGIGGGGFMMIRLAAKGETVIVDSRETAPAAVRPDMFVGVPEPSRQGVAVGVPGMVRGTDLALKRYGTRSLAWVLEPAIRLAELGFAATPAFVASAACNEPNSRALNSPEVAAYFCPGGKSREPGSPVKNPSLAHTLRLIARHGADCFYRLLPATGCDIALGIVAGQRFSREFPVAGVPRPGKGGGMTLADLEAYQPVVRPHRRPLPWLPQRGPQRDADLIDHRLTSQQAIDAPRLSAFSTSGKVMLEPAFPQAIMKAMSDLGYDIVPGEVGAVQAVLRDPETGYQYGAFDGRREGRVIGLP